MTARPETRRNDILATLYIAAVSVAGAAVVVVAAGAAVVSEVSSPQAAATRAKAASKSKSRVGRNILSSSSGAGSRPIAADTIRNRAVLLGRAAGRTTLGSVENRPLVWSSRARYDPREAEHP